MREMEINSIPTVVVLAESNSLSKIPEKSGVVRVKEFHQSLVIQSDGKVGTKGTDTVLMLMYQSNYMKLFAWL